MPRIRSSPLLAKDAIAWLEKYLQPHMRVLEFGSGGSTAWFASRVQNVISIEHHPEWFASVKAVMPSNVDLRLIERPYFDVCDTIAESSLDLVLVDGRERLCCVKAARKLVKPGGALILDDGQRARYQDAVVWMDKAGWPKTIHKSILRHTYVWIRPA